MGRSATGTAVTLFEIKEFDGYLIQGGYFKAEPFEDGFLMREQGGAGQKLPITKAELSRQISLKIIKVVPDYFVRDIVKKAKLKYNLDPADLPIDVQMRWRAVMAFLEGESQGQWARSIGRATEFLAHFKALEDGIVERNKAALEGDTPRGGTAIATVRPPTDKHMVKWRQFVRLLAKFENGGHSPSSLIKLYRKEVRGTKISTETCGFARTKYLTTEKRPSATNVLSQIVAENRKRAIVGARPLQVPELRSLQRFLKSIEDLMKSAGRGGSKKARLEFALAYGGPKPTRPLERVEMDEKLLDIIVFLTDTGLIDEIHPEIVERLREMNRQDEKRLDRLWLSVAFDVASRSVLGMKILRCVKPSFRDSTEVLEMAVNSKAHIVDALKTETDWPQEGLPELIVADHGYDSFDFQHTVVSLTGHVLAPPANHPHLRGAIERFFRTIDQRYMHMFPGRTFGNPLAKGEDYSPAKFAALDDIQLAECVVRLIVDCYHNTPHSEIGDRTPLEMWGHLNKLHDVRPVDEETARMAFGITLTKRRITSDGIVVFGLPYSDDKGILQDLRNRLKKRDVSIRVSHQNLGRIWLRTEADDGYVPLDCNLSGTENLTLNKWQSVLRFMRKTVAAGHEMSWERAKTALAQIEGMVEAAERKAGIAIVPWTAERMENLEREVVLGAVFRKKSEPDYGIEIAQDLNPGTGRRSRETENPPIEKRSLDDVLGDRDDGIERDPNRFANQTSAGVRKHTKPKAKPAASQPQPPAPSPSAPRNRIGGIEPWKSKKD